MVTNVVTHPGESFLNISGNTLRLRPRIQGGINCLDGYLDITIMSNIVNKFEGGE